jgi:hypothetical protein
MPSNIVSLLMQFLTPDLIAKIASALGLDRSLAQKAIAAAIPSILAGIIGKASTGDGVRQLGTILGQQDAGLLGKLAGMLGGAQQGSLVNGGTSLLTSLLGGNALGALSSAVGKFAGSSDGPTRSLLGMLGPIVMGTLAREQQASKLDAGGVASFLMGQKDNVAQAMPAGFAQLLKGSGLLDSIESNLQKVSGAAGTAAKPATTATSPAPRPAARPSAGQTTPVPAPAPVPAAGLSSWWPWLALAALLALGWINFGQPGSRPVGQAPARLVIEGVDVGNQVGALYDGLRVALLDIKDPASAQATLPRLQEAVGRADRLNDLAGRLSADNRRSLAGVVAPYMSLLNPLFDQVLAVPALPGPVKATIDALRAKLSILARA